MVEQKQRHLSISFELHDRAASDSSFLGNVIMGDQTWVYGYDPDTRVQSSQWKSPSSPSAKKARQSRSTSNIKVVMIVFFDLGGIVQAEFVPRNTMVNCEYYKGLLEHLRNDVCRKQPEKWAEVSSSIMTTLHVTHRFWYGNFWQIKILWCILIHLIHQIWHHATSGSSPKSKWPWNVNILNRFRT